MPPISRQRETTRLETFVDAAFAFALTMLVISVDAIPGSMQELTDAFKQLPAFAASFAIVVNFWHGHYRWSRRFGVEDAGSVVLSLLLVFIVLVFLYPLRLMMSGAFSTMSGGWLPSEIQITSIDELRLLAIVYGVAFALLSGTLVALNVRLRRLPLDPPLSAEDRAVASVEAQAWGILAGLGVISSALALLLPASRIALAVWIWMSLAVIMPLMSRRWNRFVERAVRSDAPDADP